ncbi:MAG: 2-polyprenyl-3-methyl-6-methoxy-1,4-benzoquinone monooxygenase [Pseudomonadota bacterium]|nr:2-polyprenyl-3-methyl-6-methoxy-1,4-benzoquinone monooxygenase [Pseudomonadota bacterium]
MQLSFLDTVLIQVDQGLRSLFGKPVARRVNPAHSESTRLLTPEEQRLSAGLMRINHVGEVCAQALYAGQAITARSAETRAKMREAADEEIDHLAWCQERLNDLNSHTSYLNPFWYAGSFAMGIAAGLIGDKWSLGFVAETEQQVVRHLMSHLRELPANDVQSRVIVEQMRQDEAKHATAAFAAGGAELPSMVKYSMTAMSKMMTSIAYWV